jgi:hypothetical protein
MLRIYAEKYVALGRDFQEIETITKLAPAGEPKVNNEEMISLSILFSKIERHCSEIDLTVTQAIVGEINKDFENTELLMWNDAGPRVAELRRVFLAELRSKCCYMLTSERRKFYSDNASDFVSTEALAAFPSSKYDLTEAGKCFATERFTASVSHLMKVAEWPLISLASYAGAPEKDRRNWNTALNIIH